MVGEITFDGTDFSYVGPNELAAGTYSFVFRNLSEDKIDLYISTLSDGKTYQNLVELQREPGEYWPKPEWVTHDREVGITDIRADGSELHIFMLTREGRHAIYLGRNHPFGLWLCAPLLIVGE
ncbi:MAG: hypothetical protein KAU31_16060 [Spirochaetaceae bacterium]|nr:hypothetical protein [Spirochaetaceae bacterium]